MYKHNEKREEEKVRKNQIKNQMIQGIKNFSCFFFIVSLFFI